MTLHWRTDGGKKPPTHGGGESGGLTIPISVRRQNWVKLVQLHHRIITSLSPSRAIQSKPESLSILLRSRPYKKSRYPPSSSPFKFDGYIRVFLQLRRHCSCHVALFSNNFHYRSTQRSSRDARGIIWPSYPARPVICCLTAVRRRLFSLLAKSSISAEQKLGIINSRVYHWPSHEAQCTRNCGRP